MKNRHTVTMKKVKDEKNDQKSNKKPSNIYRNIRLYFREYCLNSSLHGIRYLGEKGRTKTERIWWLLFFIACIFMCSQLIKKIWIKWDSKPVIIGFAEKPTFVWQIPFPAVTVCPNTKIRHRIYDYTTAFREKSYFMPYEEKKYLLYSTLVCNDIIYYNEKTMPQSAIEFIREVAPPFDELFWVYSFSGEFLFNMSYTTESITEEGLCYTFNMLDETDIFKEGVKKVHHIGPGISSDWSLNKGYKKDHSKDLYPKRAFGKGTNFKILLRAYKQDFDYICKDPSQGVKIIFHNPEELPRIYHHPTIKVPWNKIANIALQPDIMTASKELESYHPSKRNCFYADERNLKYFKTYTQSNCEIECFTNYTLKLCDCVAFYMPYDKYTPFCGPGKLVCVHAARTEFILQGFNDDLEELHENKENISMRLKKCNCLPECTSLKYNTESVQVDLDLDKFLHDFQIIEEDFEGMQVSRINIFFKDSQFMTWRKSELYNRTDFLANCGGLLGLFLGFSVLSLVEIIYFFTLRLMK